MTEDKIRALIASALEYDKAYDVQDIIDEVNEGRAEIWTTEKSLAVTNVVQKPKVLQFHIWIAAGDLTELMEQIYPHLETRARQLGCGIMSISGRRGWIRKLKPHGFDEVATVGTRIL